MSQERYEHRVLWWQYPSLTDVPLGPWSKSAPFYDDNPLKHWKLAVDWMADLGVTKFIGNIDLNERSARYVPSNDWPFHLVCDWPNHPNAACYDERFRTSVRNQVNPILDYLRHRGISPYIHHYNFYAPFGWWKNQPSLVESANEVGADRPLPWPAERIKDISPQLLVSSVCSTNSLYREFMKASWHELFERLPALEGLLITLGESNRCPCHLCTGGIPIDKPWNHARRAEHYEMLASFTRFYRDTITGFKRDPLCRCWHGGGDSVLSKLSPKGMPYIIKYSGFNSIDCSPDPIYRFWKNAGHEVWPVHELSGAEPGSTMTWINPGWVHEMERRSRGISKKAIIAFENPRIGRSGYAYPIMAMNIEAMLRFANGEQYDRCLWERRCIERFGPRGKVYLLAGELISQVVLNIDKVISYPADGFALCFPPIVAPDPIDYRQHKFPFPNSLAELGANGSEPHPWLREDIAPLRFYKRYLEDEPACEGWMKRAIPAGFRDPLEFWNEIIKEPVKAVRLLEDNVPQEEEEDHTIHQLLLISARFAEQFGIFTNCLLRTKTDLWAANSLRSSLDIQRKHAISCLSYFDKAIDALIRMQGLYYQYPPKAISWSHGMNKTFFEDHIVDYRRQRIELYHELKDLVDGKALIWPTSIDFVWPPS